MPFSPSIVIFRKNALEYPLGTELYDKFNNLKDTTIHTVANRGPFPLDYDLSFKKKFLRAKKTIVISVRTINKFQSCKPSAHYQLPLVSGCPAHCHYCYLSTNLGKNPYIKIYVNIEEIFEKAKKYMNEREPETTVFEGSATSDPLPVERWSGSLAKTIEFFADERLGRFRFVSELLGNELPSFIVA
jgi:spore photoproduct lyase